MRQSLMPPVSGPRCIVINKVMFCSVLVTCEKCNVNNSFLTCNTRKVTIFHDNNGCLVKGDSNPNDKYTLSEVLYESWILI